MNGPTPLGMVLAMLVDPKGKVVRGGAGKGQLYASRDELVVLKPTATEEIVHRLTTAALFMSVFIVVGNLFTFKEPAAIWIGVALQAVYWLTLPRRRRALEPAPISAGDLDQAKKAGRALVQIPSGAIVKTVPPEPPTRGFRKPARFVLPDGALEIYLSEEQFRSAVTALGRAA
jgi:hypothetical protein